MDARLRLLHQARLRTPERQFTIMSPGHHTTQVAHAHNKHKKAAVKSQRWPSARLRRKLGEDCAVGARQVQPDAAGADGHEGRAAGGVRAEAADGLLAGLGVRLAVDADVSADTEADTHARVDRVKREEG